MRTALFALLFFAKVGIQAQEPLKIARLNEAVHFDGKVDESVWEAATVLPLTMQKPEFGLSPSERTEVFLAYDDQYLYLAGRMHVGDPSLIRGPVFRRDISDSASDYFGIIVDNFNDKENAVAFFTAPTGMRWDAIITNDGEGVHPINQGWNSFWDVRIWRSSHSWQVEMRIPFSTLRFQNKGGNAVMGITCFRYQGAKGERDVFPAFPEDWGPKSVWKPSQAREIVLEGVRSRRPLYIAPYLLAGISESANLREGMGRYQQLQEPVFEMGADLKYGLTNDLTLDITVNTDFSQVDNDEAQVNLTRFSLFLPEKRQFFLERAGIFDFNFDDVNRLFYSRRIGLHDGQPVRIYGGARLVGRIGQQDIGLLNMQTAATDGLASENFTVLRTRRRIFNDHSYFGAILSNRSDFQGRYNTAVGLDGQFRVIGDEYFSVKWAQTFDQATDHPLGSPAGARFNLRWERRRFNGLSYHFDLARAGAGYEPGIGFEQRKDFHSLDASWAYGWTAGSQSSILRFQVFFDVYGAFGNQSGRLETGIVETGALLETKNAWKAAATAVYDREMIASAFTLTEATSVPEGSHTFLQLKGYFMTPQTKMLRAKLDIAGGGFYDGHLVSLGLTPTWKANPHLEISGTYQINRISFSGRRQRDNTHLARLQVQYFWDTRWSAVAFLQYNDLDRQVLTNFRLHFNPGEGNDFYLVFNDLLNRQRERTEPVLPAHEYRKVSVKYTYTFRF